jgi:hypothetical protein
MIKAERELQPIAQRTVGGPQTSFSLAELFSRPHGLSNQLQQRLGRV